MRFMVMIRANKDSESGILPDKKVIAQMGKFNEELVKAGVMLAAEGLYPTSTGAKITFPGGKLTVTDGPFIETKEHIAGFWLWKVKSREEVIEWIRRSGMQCDIDIREIFDPQDFEVNLSPDLREQNRRVRSQLQPQ